MKKKNITINTALVSRNIDEDYSKNDSLQLSPIILDEDYRKKWNISSSNFLCLTKNGQLISDSLYRVGGYGGKLEGYNKNYIILIKHVEAYYPDNITNDKNRKPHLESRWCIIDKNGIEKLECKPYSTPYITQDSIIYSVNNRHYNIETEEFYCDSSGSMESKEFLFLNNPYDKDLSKKGIMKINKKTGEWEVFPA